MKKLFCLEFSFRNISLAEREAVAFAAQEGNVTDCERPLELVVVVTCNRVELYLIGEGDAWRADKLTEAVATRLALSRGPMEALLQKGELHEDKAAARHALRVAAGLESQILGEPQIQGQMAAAGRQPTAGPVLQLLFQCATRAGRRARSETTIGRHSASISTAAVQLAARQLGTLSGTRAAIVGAGSMGLATARALQPHRLREIVVLNRTTENADRVAAAVGGIGRSFDALEQTIGEVDLLIMATTASQPLLTEANVATAVAGRQRPLIIVDLAVPRNVAPNVAGLKGVQLFDIDQLTDTRDDAFRRRARAIPAVEAIVEDELARFERLRAQMSVRPLIADLHRFAEEIRRHEVERLKRQASHLDADAIADIERFSQSLVRKLLHRPTVRLKHAAEANSGDEWGSFVRDLFDLVS